MLRLFPTEMEFSDQKPNLTCLAVVPLHVDAKDGDALPLDVLVVEVDVRDGDVPGRQVPGGAGRGRRLHGGVVLQHHHGFLHLRPREEPAVLGDGNHIHWLF